MNLLGDDAGIFRVSKFNGLPWTADSEVHVVYISLVEYSESIQQDKFVQSKSIPFILHIWYYSSCCPGDARSHDIWARFLSPILSQVTWQVTWPRLRSQVTSGVFCLCFLKWLHKSLGPKSLGLFWNAPYCFPSDALLTSPCISGNTIVTSRVNTIVTSLNAAPSQPTMSTMLSQPMASHP